MNELVAFLLQHTRGGHCSEFCQFCGIIVFPSFWLQLEKGVDGLFDSFARLDTRISSVGQTAAKIGDHLQVMNSISRVFYCVEDFDFVFL